MKYLEKETREIREVIKSVVKKSIPDNLKQYTGGFTTTLLLNEAENNFYSKVLKDNQILNFEDLIKLLYFCNFKVK